MTETIAQGRACVRLIEAVGALLEVGRGDLNSKEANALVEARALAVKRLRVLVAELPPEAVAQILAASEKLGGFPVGEIGAN